MILAIIFLVGVAASVSAAPQDIGLHHHHQPRPEVQLLRYENENDGLGSYRFGYELSDGTKREERGEVRNIGTPAEALNVEGSYTWVAPDASVWLVTFLANEGGFQPKVVRIK